MSGAFVDTSALAKRYLAEPDSGEFDAWFVQAVPVAVSLLATVELSSTLSKACRAGRLTASHLAEVEVMVSSDIADGCIEVVEVAASAFHVARALIGTHAELGLRTLDDLQLAVALQLGASKFVTADRKLAAAATASGLQVLVFGSGL